MGWVRVASAPCLSSKKHRKSASLPHVSSPRLPIAGPAPSQQPAHTRNHRGHHAYDGASSCDPRAPRQRWRRAVSSSLPPPSPLTARGCDPPSLALASPPFLNASTSITQPVTCQACQPGRRIPGSHLHGFVPGEKSASARLIGWRRGVSKKLVRGLQQRMGRRCIAPCRFVTGYWLRALPKDSTVVMSTV